jgi:Uri superfamily endonuclease
MILALARARVIRAGALGRRRFDAGIYLYAGSARGPGGIAARLGHHWRRSARPRWHLDYLRRAATPVGAGFRTGTSRLECRWAALVAALPGAEAGPSRFGASDCGCDTHLFRLDAGRPGVAGAVAARVDPVLECECWLDARGVRRAVPAPTPA